MSAVMWIIQAVYFVAAVLFIVGLKGMSSPRTARRGFILAGVGMLMAVVATFFLPGVGGVTNIILILIAMALSGVLSWVSGKRVPMTAMPQMVALYNGMGGGAAAAIAARALITGAEHGTSEKVLAVVGALIGAVSFSGSLIAFAKLQGWMSSWRFRAQNAVNAAVLVAVAVFAVLSIVYGGAGWLFIFFLVALAFGVLVTVPVGGAELGERAGPRRLTRRTGGEHDRGRQLARPAALDQGGALRDDGLEPIDAGEGDRCGEIPRVVQVERRVDLRHPRAAGAKRSRRAPVLAARGSGSADLGDRLDRGLSRTVPCVERVGDDGLAL